MFPIESFLENKSKIQIEFLAGIYLVYGLICVVLRLHVCVLYLYFQKKVFFLKLSFYHPKIFSDLTFSFNFYIQFEIKHIAFYFFFLFEIKYIFYLYSFPIRNKKDYFLFFFPIRNKYILFLFLLK